MIYRNWENDFTVIAWEQAIFLLIIKCTAVQMNTRAFIIFLVIQ